MPTRLLWFAHVVTVLEADLLSISARNQPGVAAALSPDRSATALMGSAASWPTRSVSGSLLMQTISPEATFRPAVAVSLGSLRSHSRPHIGILTDSIVIAIKSPIVIGKRMAIFARDGRRAKVEVRTAVKEKTSLAGSSAASLVSAKLLASVVRRTRQKVEANARRL